MHLQKLDACIILDKQNIKLNYINFIWVIINKEQKDKVLNVISKLELNFSEIKELSDVVVYRANLSKVYSIKSTVTKIAELLKENEISFTMES